MWFFLFGVIDELEFWVIMSMWIEQLPTTELSKPYEVAIVTIGVIQLSSFSSLAFQEHHCLTNLRFTGSLVYTDFDVWGQVPQRPRINQLLLATFSEIQHSSNGLFFYLSNLGYLLDNNDQMLYIHVYKYMFTYSNITNMIGLWKGLHGETGHQFSLDPGQSAKAHEFALVIPYTFETLLVLHYKAAQTSWWWWWESDSGSRLTKDDATKKTRSTNMKHTYCTRICTLISCNILL